MSGEIRILMVEDQPTDAELALRELKRAGMEVVHRVVDTRAGMRDALETFAPDVILSDYALPNFDGIRALALALERAPDTPFIFVSGTLGEEHAVQALKCGAADYVVKDKLLRLPAAVARAIEEARERGMRRKAEEDLAATRRILGDIFNSLQDVVWSLDVTVQQLVYVSPAAAIISGREPDEVPQTLGEWRRVVAPEDLGRVDDAADALGHGEAIDVEVRVVRPDGRPRWVNVRARPVWGPQGVQRIDGVARDITEAVEQRRRLARLGRIRELLGEINAAIVRIRDRDALLAQVCRIAVDRGGMLGARVGVLDAAGATVLPLASAGASIGYADAPVAVSGPPDEEWIVAAAVRARRPAIENDAARDVPERFRAAVAAAGVGAIACFPVLRGDAVAATLVLCSGERGFFEEEEAELLRQVTGNVSFALELIAQQERVEYLALYDVLTGLPNRRLIQERLQQAIGSSAAENGAIALLVIDLQHFKDINDSLGQHAGDRVLQMFAERLRAWVGDPARIGRLGGDHFALFLTQRRDATALRRVAEALQAELLEHVYPVEGRELRVAPRFGIALYPNDGADAETLFHNAEAALKQAREHRQRYLFYAPHINAGVSERLELEAKLRTALRERQFLLHYQPKVDLATREIRGVEALIRWHDPGQGLVPPARFVGVLEETGLIAEVGDWVIREALATYAAWRRKGLPAPRISVNVSTVQLRSDRFVPDLAQLLAATDPADRGLDVEITESLLMENLERAIRQLEEIRALGVEIALDDFGTGYSSLSYITRLPIQAIKIDRAFIRGITENPTDTAVATAVLSLAQSLRLKAVAEGVETEAQAELLRLLRCDLMQGYLFCRPVPAAEIEALLRAPARTQQP